MIWNIFTVLLLAFSVYATNKDLKFISYKNDARVPVVNGRCGIYEDKLLEHGEVWYRTDFCEKISCSVMDTTGHSEIRGCVPLTPISQNCTVVGRRGPYPECCSGEIVCNQQPEVDSNEAIVEEIRLLLERNGRK
uniref:Venom protein n=1 Tax=Centruroides hentzi TaxID=88313 RepID=A0A2I9LPY2_9SCOR